MKKRVEYSEHSEHLEPVECFVRRVDVQVRMSQTSPRAEPARTEAGGGAAGAVVAPPVVPVRQARVEGWTLNPDWRPPVSGRR